MLDKLYEAFVKDSERMIFKFWIIMLALFGGGFCLLSIAVLIYVLK